MPGARELASRRGSERKIQHCGSLLSNSLSYQALISSVAVSVRPHLSFATLETHHIEFQEGVSVLDTGLVLVVVPLALCCSGYSMSVMSRPSQAATIWKNREFILSLAHYRKSHIFFFLRSMTDCSTEILYSSSYRYRTSFELNRVLV